MHTVKWFAVMLVLAVPIMVAGNSLLYLLVQPFGIHMGLHWPNRIGRERAAAERGTLTRAQYSL